MGKLEGILTSSPPFPFTSIPIRQTLSFIVGGLIVLIEFPGNTGIVVPVETTPVFTL